MNFLPGDLFEVQHSYQLGLWTSLFGREQHQTTYLTGWALVLRAHRYNSIPVVFVISAQGSGWLFIDRISIPLITLHTSRGQSYYV